MAFGFEHKRPAQEGADNDQDAENKHIGDGGVQHDGVDDIGGNEQLQRNLNPAADCVLEIADADLHLAVLEKPNQVAEYGEENGNGDDEHRQDLQGKGDVGDDRHNSLIFVQQPYEHFLFIILYDFLLLKT